MNKALACHCQPKAEPGHEIGCVLSLPFRYLSGEKFMDRSVYGHLCTNHGSKWQLDGRYFDGNNNYVEIPIGDWVTGMTRITIASRAKTASAIPSSRMVVNREQNPGGFALGAGWNANKFTFWANPGTWTSAHGATSIVIGISYVVEGSFNGYNILLFVDGKQDGSNTHSGNLGGGIQNVRIGIQSNSLDYDWHGLIGDTLIYNFADYAPRILSRSIGG